MKKNVREWIAAGVAGIAGSIFIMLLLFIHFDLWLAGLLGGFGIAYFLYYKVYDWLEEKYGEK